MLLVSIMGKLSRKAKSPASGSTYKGIALPREKARWVWMRLTAAGTYTPPIAPSPLASARVLRRAHLILEMEKMPVYRDQILSTTGEILCIDGTRKVCTA